MDLILHSNSSTHYKICRINYRHNYFLEFKKAAKAVLEHHFNNHKFCGEWCPANKWKIGVSYAVSDLGRWRKKNIFNKTIKSRPAVDSIQD
jgi:hypothetical protein